LIVALSLPAIETRAKVLKLLLFDVDGVLTDGSVIIHGDGTESKAFFIRDGSALVRARRQGLEIGFLSGRSSDSTKQRAAELGITIVIQGENDKMAGFQKILQDTGLSREQVAYMGDDLLDLPVLQRAGLSAAPADAVEDVRVVVDWVSLYAGGRGAVREFVDVLLRARA
jgi:3-deoxy-D-manno-octulosonate 8-phosphate phosphatase (KDO 8-P phosphatase)